MRRHSAPVARYTSIKTIISLASLIGWKLHRMVVKDNVPQWFD
jgi:hypothetical protein